MEIHFAPLQGYADHIYRRIHAEIYGGIDCYYTPFIRLEKGDARRQDINRLKESLTDDFVTIPQIIFNSVNEFYTLVTAIHDTDAKKIDLNLGCPYPMQTRRGRGCALICDVKTMDRIADLIHSDYETEYSVKMRLGRNDKKEWRLLMPVLNSVELSHITMHPRIGKEMFGNDIYKDEFRELCEVSTNPVIWNGDIRTLTDIDNITNEFPGLKGVMIGRGLLARPSLAAEWRTSEEWSREKRVGTLIEMHDRILDEYEKTLCGQTQILQKIKPFWDYLEWEIGHKTLKAIKKATTLDKYRTAVGGIE